MHVLSAFLPGQGRAEAVWKCLGPPSYNQQQGTRLSLAYPTAGAVGLGVTHVPYRKWCLLPRDGLAEELGERGERVSLMRSRLDGRRERARLLGGVVIGDELCALDAVDLLADAVGSLELAPGEPDGRDDHLDRAIGERFGGVAHLAPARVIDELLGQRLGLRTGHRGLGGAGGCVVSLLAAALAATVDDVVGRQRRALAVPDGEHGEGSRQERVEDAERQVVGRERVGDTESDAAHDEHGEDGDEGRRDFGNAGLTVGREVHNCAPPGDIAGVSVAFPL